MMHGLDALLLLHPGALWLLLLLPLGWFWLSRGGNGERALSRLVDPALMPHLLAGRRRRAAWPWLVFTLAGLLTVAAMAGPAWRQKPQPLYSERAAQVVALSMSQRMLARDVTPDRLTRARYKVHALLQANRGGQNALVAYAGEAFVVAPLTRDADALSDLLDALSPGTMPTPGDNAADAIRRGVSLLEDAGAQDGSLVLVTDSADAHAIDAARAARAKGVRVSVLAVGHAGKGAPVPAAGGGFITDDSGRIVLSRREDGRLRALADAGGGRFVAMSDNGDDIHALAAELRHGHGATRSRDRASRQWIDEGPWFALALVPLLALSFRRGWLLLMCLACLPLCPATARAGTWQDLWQRRDQQAEQALRAGHAARAEVLAHSPMLRGTAAYRAEHYKIAAQAFRQAGGAQGLYNLGNALARQGHYRQAIDAYDKALQADPAHADAKANRQAIEAWLKKHKPPKQGGKGAQDDKQGGKGQQGGSSQHAPGQGKKTGQKAGKPGQAGRKGGSQAGDGQHDRNAPADKRSGDKDKSGANPDQDKRSRQQAEQARKAMKKQMDKALGHTPAPGSKQAPPADGSFALGQQPASKDANKKALSAPLRQALDRVPDDPGGLLRRKFMLEYQRRRQGGDPGDGGPP